MSVNTQQLSIAVSSAIEQACSANQDSFRTHLGASDIGHKCSRFIWYKFRWCFKVEFDGRMMRLFNRGHEEEHRFARWLTNAGFKVDQFDFTHNKLYFSEFPEPEFLIGSVTEMGVQWRDVTQDKRYHKTALSLGYELPQYGFKSIGGHFAGSCDGKVWVPKDWGFNKPFLLECKTNKTGTEFNKLIKNGVRSEKRTHYSQSNVYASKMDLDYILYLNTDKNNDQIHCEVIATDKNEALQMEQKAESIIASMTPPPRLSDNPAYWECKMCDAKDICFGKRPVEKNCRSCCFAIPADNNEWFCSHSEVQQNIPKDFIKVGCAAHSTVNKR